MDINKFSEKDTLENTLLKIKDMPELQGKPVCFMLIGLQASGKSTISQEIIKTFPGITHKDLDSIILEKSATEGISYHEIQRDNKLKTRCEAQLSQSINTLIKAKQSFIWEQLNTTKNSRTTKCIRVKRDVIRQGGTGEVIQDAHILVGIYTNVPLEELNERLRKRNQVDRGTLKEKFISLKILNNLFPEYVHPQPDEPFDLLFECNQDFQLTLKPSTEYSQIIKEKKHKNRPSDEEIERRRSEKHGKKMKY